MFYYGLLNGGILIALAFCFMNIERYLAFADQKGLVGILLFGCLIVLNVVVHFYEFGRRKFDG